MCRAVWVVVYASGERAKQIRRAVGADAQVVLMTDDAAQIGSTEHDVLVVDGDTAGARDVSGAKAVLWIGEDPPDQAHHVAALSDDLSGAVVQALLASKRPG
ncbi:MAG: hypothetical protein LC663_03685 [Actinobacteria bacterium]|nr:hypothetical protein [Actinomycetota bacterium]